MDVVYVLGTGDNMIKPGSIVLTGMRTGVSLGLHSQLSGMTNRIVGKLVYEDVALVIASQSFFPNAGQEALVLTSEGILGWTWADNLSVIEERVTNE